jgi:protein-S-isoprenylcysteine O-methyltransferase Ste14
MSDVSPGRFMTEQFPDNYPVYKRSTKMLVPFIF